MKGGRLIEGRAIIRGGAYFIIMCLGWALIRGGFLSKALRYVQHRDGSVDLNITIRVPKKWLTSGLLSFPRFVAFDFCFGE